MAIIKTKSYYVKPSDSREWLIIGDIINHKEVDVEIKTLDYLFHCEPKEIEIDGIKVMCSRLCCYTGCYVSKEEINEAQRQIPKISSYLQEDSIKLLKLNNFQIYNPDDYDPEENLYKIRCAPAEWNFADDDEENEDDDEEMEDNKETNVDEENDEFDLPPRNHCIFLMKNGYCALHKYYLDANENWIKKKFNICSTFPLDLRPQDGTMAFMSDFNEFAFGEVECLCSDRDLKEKLNYPQIIEEMRDVIIDRFGETWFGALSQCAKDFRVGTIDLDYIYSDVDLE